MSQYRKILIKRRSIGGSGPPITLLNGELAFNEIDRVLYYGTGLTPNSVEASEIISIGGSHTDLLLNAQQTTISSPTTASSDYIVINVQGRQRAIRLFDF